MKKGGLGLSNVLGESLNPEKRPLVKVCRVFLTLPRREVYRGGEEISSAVLQGLWGGGDLGRVIIKGD